MGNLPGDEGRKMPQIESSAVLLLTATIDPGATPLVARKDPAVRLRDYQNSLLAWLSCGATRKIVLYENSGSDISSLRDTARRFPDHEVEFHSFSGNESGPSKGKGYSELLGIARILQESQLIRSGKFIVKCTGRFTVKNARKLFPMIEATEFDVMCTLGRNLTFADSRLFAARPEFLTQYLVPQQPIIDDCNGVFFEHALACATARALADRKRWAPFPIFPDIRGISGTFGVSQTFGARARARESIYHQFGNFLYKR
jgi:hypothetical protein